MASAPVVDAQYLKEIEEARRDLRELIASKGCAPIMLRLAWHDAGTFDAKTRTGGPNGSIRNEAELKHAANAGLKIAVDLCEPIKSKHPRMTLNSGGWLSRELRRAPQSEKCLLEAIGEMVSSRPLSSNPDRWHWGNEACGIYTVRALYRSLASEGLPMWEFHRTVWKAKAPPKIRCFSWLALNNKILTKDLLSRKGWNGDTSCLFCGFPSETSHHLLIECDFAKAIWNLWAPGWLRNRVCVNLKDLFSMASPKPFLHKKTWTLCIMATIYEIWIIRNKSLFEAMTLPPPCPMKDILHNIWTWNKHIPKKEKDRNRVDSDLSKLCSALNLQLPTSPNNSFNAENEVEDDEQLHFDPDEDDLLGDELADFVEETPLP